MKQMRFFTNDASTVTALQTAIIHKGLTNNRLRIFCKDNSRHNFDGLLLSKKNVTQERKMQLSLSVMVCSFMAAAALMTTGLIDFISVSVVLLVPLSAYLMFDLYKTFKRQELMAHNSGKASLQKRDDTVYFMVIDVDDLAEKRVSNIARKLPDLVAH